MSAVLHAIFVLGALVLIACALAILLPLIAILVCVVWLILDGGRSMGRPGEGLIRDR